MPINEMLSYIQKIGTCKKQFLNEIPLSTVRVIEEEVIVWAINTQLSRRNLSPIQRIAVTEKYRPIYEKKAKENQGTRTDLKNNNILTNSSKSEDSLQSVNVRATLAKTASVSEDTYSKGKKILDSDNETLKQEVLSGEKSINASYKELIQME